MTTAHRPTFHTAVGGKEQGGGRYIAGVSRQHVHDLPGQMSIKTRQQIRKAFATFDADRSGCARRIATPRDGSQAAGATSKRVRPWPRVQPSRELPPPACPAAQMDLAGRAQRRPPSVRHVLRRRAPSTDVR